METIFPVFVSVSAITFIPVAWFAVKPVTDPTGKQDAFHVKVLPVTSGINGMFRVVPEQTGSGCEFIRWGTGFTVTM